MKWLLARTVFATALFAPQLVLGQSVLFEDNFSDGAAGGWIVGSGTWAVEGFEYGVVTTPYGGWSHSNAGDTNWTDYILEAKAKLVTAEGYLSLRFRYQDDANYYQFMFRKNAAVDSPDTLRLERRVSGTYYEVGSDELMSGSARSRTDVLMPIVSDRWYSLKVVVNGGSIRVYVDGVLKYDIVDGTYTRGRISLGAHAHGGGYTIPTHARFDDIRVLAASVDGGVSIHPKALRLSSSGNFVTAYLTLPFGYAVGDIDPSSVQLTAIDGSPVTAIAVVGHAFEDTDGDTENDTLMVKFDRAAVVSRLPANATTRIEVSGQLVGGPRFVAADTIRTH